MQKAIVMKTGILPGLDLMKKADQIFGKSFRLFDQDEEEEMSGMNSTESSIRVCAMNVEDKLLDKLATFLDKLEIPYQIHNESVWENKNQFSTSESEVEED